MEMIYCGEAGHVLRDFEDECIDLVVTSPPYDQLRDYKGYVFDFKDFKAIARELTRGLRPGGVIVWVVGDQTIKGSESGSSFQQALFFKELGLNLHDTMIWNKGSGPFPDKIRYTSSFEYMFVFSKGVPKTVNLIADKKNRYAGETMHGTDRQKNGKTVPKSAVKLGNGRIVKEFGTRTNLWQISHTGKAGNPHPATFPFQIPHDHILTWSNEGDVVLDPFAGSGTTLKAAAQLNRKWIGIDISEEYCALSRKVMGV